MRPCDRARDRTRDTRCPCRLRRGDRARRSGRRSCRARDTLARAARSCRAALRSHHSSASSTSVAYPRRLPKRCEHRGRARRSAVLARAAARSARAVRARAWRRRRDAPRVHDRDRGRTRRARDRDAALRVPVHARGQARPDKPEVAEATVRAVWDAAAKRYAKLPRFAGGKSFGGRMTSRAHAARRSPACAGWSSSASRCIRPRSRGSSAPSTSRSRPGRCCSCRARATTLRELALLRPVVAQLGRARDARDLEGADHGFTRAEGRDRRRSRRRSTAWIDRILDS